jgi:predicted Zn finger-like uncharacterized protein
VQAQCSQCATRIQIDDAKVPDRPFKVKCPKCQAIIPLPGAYLAIGMPGGTMTFFSPSLYLTSRSWPSLPATVVATLALVMVLPGRLSHSENRSATTPF